MAAFREYAEHGWKLCGIEPGSKCPTYARWSDTPIPLDAADGLVGAGVLHALSGTCAIDIDDVLEARIWLAERGVDLDALLEADDAVLISSGRPNRAKLLYRLSKPLVSKKIIFDKRNIIDFRCGTANGKSVQDVLPPTVHPDTKRPYEWRCGIVGDWRKLPPIPPVLLQAWREIAEPMAGSAPVATPAPSADVERLRALLTAHDPDMDYHAWIKVGMAVHHESSGSPIGLAVWNEWSEKGVKYQGISDLRVHWASFASTPGKRVTTAASLEVERPATADEFPAPPASGSTLTDAAPVDKPKLGTTEPKAGTAKPETTPPAQRKRNPRMTGALGMQLDERDNQRINTLNASRQIRNMVGNGTIELTWDEFLNKKMVRWPNEDTLHSWEKIDSIRLQMILQHNGLFTLMLASARDAADVVAHEHLSNVVRDWLSSLKWDGERRITLFLPHAFGTPSTHYYWRSGRNWLISMAARAFEPACQVGTATILEGPQWGLKSSALREIGKPWYFELVANPDHKDFEQQLRGVWLGEFPELHSVQKAAIERIKQFVTNRNDRYRPSYGEDEVDHPRRCVLVGTTNRSDWARDDTGNNRFIPVECGTIDMKWLIANRDQLFAEAVYAYKHGRKYHHWHKADLFARQAARVPYDVWQDRIETNWKDAARTDETGREFVTVARVLEDIVGIQTAAQTAVNAGRVAVVLRQLGFESGSQRRIDGVRCRPWFAPPGFSAEHDPLLG